MISSLHLTNPGGGTGSACLPGFELSHLIPHPHISEKYWNSDDTMSKQLYFSRLNDNTV